MAASPPRSTTRTDAAMRVAFIGCSGVPNRYGGFEAFVEHCGPVIARNVQSVVVTCDAHLYPERGRHYRDMDRTFIPVRANGGASVLHDAAAFLSVFRQATHIVVLGVSGGIWFPFFRLLCGLGGKRLIVNVDGVEWRRTKFSRGKRLLLRVFDWLAQRCAHVVVYDNPALRGYVLPSALPRARQIGYSGDHVLRLPGIRHEPGTALTVCRIEPENHVDVLIEGFLNSPLKRYTVVGNWNHSAYGRELRERHAGNPRLALLDSLYDPQQLAQLRESCEIYLHGHSVGGTNPSLVEMLFYDCRLLCFDVPFNRETAGECADYFQDAASLSALLVSSSSRSADRTAQRAAFSAQRIASQYLEAMQG